jgi:hypothetical protein
LRSGNHARVVQVLSYQAFVNRAKRPITTGLSYIDSCCFEKIAKGVACSALAIMSGHSFRSQRCSYFIVRQKRGPIAALAIDLRSPLNAPPPVGRAPAAARRGSTLGEEALSPRGRASHSVDGGSTRYVMTSFLLIPRRYSCRELRRLAQINAKLRTRRASLLRKRVRAPHDNSILIQIAASPSRRHGAAAIFSPLPSTTWSLLDAVTIRCG